MMLSDADPAQILLPYVHRADELQKYEPLVAYHCRLYAMNRVLKLPKKERTKSSDALVVSLMKQLEKDKKSVELSSDDGRYVESFATKLFMRADKQERCGKANLNTAKTFYAASLFFEIMHNFGDLPFDVEKKQRYAAWRAAEIRKALKKVSKPLTDPPACDKVFQGSDGGINPESPSEKKSADSHDPSFPSEQSSAVWSEGGAEQDQLPLSTKQSCENLRDPWFILNTQSGGALSAISNCYQQDSSDDDQSFHSCSEGPDDDMLFVNEMASRLDQTISPLAHVQGQAYHATEILENDVQFSNNTGSVFKCTISIPADVQSQHFHVLAAEQAEHTVLLSNGTGSNLDRTISAPADVQGKQYHPSAAEIVKALKVSRLAVSALAFDDVPSAVSYLTQALDLLTNPPPIQP